MHLLRKLFLRDFGVDLPIEGGLSKNIDDAVVILPTRDYVSVEYAYVDCICKGRRAVYQVLQSTLMHNNGRTIDQLKIEAKFYDPREDADITQVENYYFDITDCL